MIDAAPGYALPATGLEERDVSIVCFAGVDWWYHNRGHSECQIMKRLAGRGRVLWVNSIGMRMPSSSNTDLVLRRYLRKARSTLKCLRRDESGMWILSPLFVPRYDATWVERNGWLLEKQVRLAMRWIGMRDPAVWVTVPTAAPACDRLRPRRIAFNRSDEFSAFPEANAEFIRPLEERLLREADVVYYVNRVLFERERGRVSDARLLGHGVDFEHFAGATRGARVPSELAGLPRPWIGFYGAFDSYTIDLELLVRVAREFPAATVVLIGPQAMDLGSILAMPNVRYLGPKPYAELPRYAVEFDVALMPWLRNEWIRGCNPIKMKEYLALGVPVVSIDFPELAPYRHLVHVAEDESSFVAGVRAGLAENDATARAARQAAVAEDSWDAIAERVWNDLHPQEVAR